MTKQNRAARRYHSNTKHSHTIPRLVTRVEGKPVVPSKQRWQTRKVR